MRFSQFWPVIILFVIGCDCAKNEDASPKRPESDACDWISEDLFKVAAQIKLESISNLSRVPQRQVTVPPQVIRKVDEIELPDLGLIFRRVQPDPNTIGKSPVYLSETEVTNQMYSVYLRETGQLRNDTEIEKAAKGEFTRMRRGDSLISFHSSASPSIHVKDFTSLWRDNAFPRDRGDHPVSCVTMAESTEFCKWVNTRYELDGLVRLPTEKEWLFAAYGADRKYPWGNEEKVWTSKLTEPVKNRPDLRTPDGLFGMWGNVTELVLSSSNGYGGGMSEKDIPFITAWQGPSYEDSKIGGKTAQPRQDYWGYTHSTKSRDDQMGFRIAFVPSK